MVSFAIINTWLLTMQEPGLGIIENGTLAIENDSIVYAGPSDGFDSSSASTIIDGSHRVTMPGLVNTHFHSAMTLLRGGAQDMPEIEWMNPRYGPTGRSRH
jgi:5-methylthioadenosine/S-adenosylhomocysteine deaminase